ncbi:hypothetical protein KQX54_021331 [Cotesia glomerata]|uniref:Major facilitator superfamily (MFS) profile domain-containing protein n=1 Tax=Cotesia glomerata TaxID=32391 RepID=A0AAV7J9I5_COTGL|nr:hypothetical protein KQX54_021331 [Cotesia glomerata]
MENKERNKIQKECLLQAIDDMGGRSSKLLWVIFIVNFFTLQLYGNNSMSYVFISEVPEFHCSIPELKNANWTTNQINEIAIVDPCTQYKLNYTHLANLGYDNALEFIKESEFLPSVVSCTSFTFNESVHSTIVDEWELVCEKKLYRANTFLAYSLGVMVGSGILGTIADKYGRKNSLIISIVLQVIASPASALVPWFWMFIICKFFIGMSTGAMYSSSFTILSEVATGNIRKACAGVLDASFSIGTFFVIGMAYYLQTWRQLQLAISCSMIPIILLIWFLPESPRWLISQNRFDEAQKIIEKYHKSFVMTPNNSLEDSKTDDKFSLSKLPNIKQENDGFFHRNVESLRTLLMQSDLRKKILIMYFSYYVTAATSYALIFSIDNFKSDRYVYVAILAFNDIIAHLSILAILIYLSGQKALIMTHSTASLLMITILAIPEDNKNIIMGLALAAKFCAATSFTANLVLLSELFPTNVKNTALGTCVVMGQVGSMTSPYIVDVLGSIAWWAPTTLCSTLSLMAGLLCLTIPRTRINDESR